MAPKRRSKPPSPRSKPSRPAHWYLQLGRQKARERAELRVRQGMLSREDIPDYVSAAGLRARLSTRDYLSRTVKDLRKYFTGFEARDGYDLTELETWSAQKARQVRQYGEYLHLNQSSPYVDVRPTRYHGKRREEFRQQLRRATGQGSKRQKVYLYHVDQTARPTDVRLTRAGQLETREQVRDTYVTRQYWYFRDYTSNRQQPRTFTQIVKATMRMLEDMPEHLWYSLFTSPNGNIDVPVQKKFILATLQRYQAEYGNVLHEGFPEQLLGFVFAGTREQAMTEYAERLERRQRAAFMKSEVRQQQRRRLAFQRRMGRVR